MAWEQNWNNPDTGVNRGRMQSGGLAGGIGQIAGGVASLFGHKRNPADAANKYLDQIPGQTGQYYNPYINAGRSALDQYQNQIGQLTGNTGDVYNRLAGGYQESPGYQFALREALGAGGNAAAAGGMLGTPAHQQTQMQTAQGLASQDFNNYLQNQMGLYGMGMQGLGGLNQMGYNAATGYGDILGSNLARQGQYAYEGQKGRNQAFGQGVSDIFSGAASALPYLFL